MPDRYRQQAVFVVARISQRAVHMRPTQPLGIAESHRSQRCAYRAARQKDFRHGGETLWRAACRRVQRRHVLRLPGDIGTLVEQPRGERLLAGVRRDMQWRQAVARMAYVYKAGVRRHQRAHAFLVPPLHGLEERIGRARLPHGRLSQALLLLTNDGHDIAIAPFHGDRERARRLPVRVDADTGVGAVLHQDAHERRFPRQNGGVQSPVPAGEVWVWLDDRADSRFVASAHGRQEPLAHDAACCASSAVSK